MDTRKHVEKRKIYRYNEYIIMDVSWGQYAEGGNDKTRTIFQGTNSCSGFKGAMKNNEKNSSNYTPCAPLVVHSDRHKKTGVANV